MKNKLQVLMSDGFIKVSLAKITFWVNFLRHFNFLKSFKNKTTFHKSTLFLDVKWTFKGVDNIIRTAENVTLRNLTIEVNGSNNSIFFGKNVKFYEFGKLLIEGNNCKIIIGDYTTVGSANIFCTESDTSIHIGNDCMLGREIKILTGDFHSIIDLETNKRINPSKDVIIGDHVWIGYHSSVSKGAKISNNTVVASYSLVNKQYEESNVILAGSPAKVIRKNIDWDRKKLPISED